MYGNSHTNRVRGGSRVLNFFKHLLPHEPRHGYARVTPLYSPQGGSGTRNPRGAIHADPRAFTTNGSARLMARFGVSSAFRYQCVSVRFGSFRCVSVSVRCVSVSVSTFRYVINSVRLRTSAGLSAFWGVFHIHELASGAPGDAATGDSAAAACGALLPNLRL